ncbi:MAG TPA: hypothetical protein VF552_09760 [Allosphingosinicella sp.]|jgi:hypothetical protein
MRGPPAPVAAAALLLAACGQSRQECLDDRHATYRDCAREAMRQTTTRSRALGRCEQDHRRAFERCLQIPKEQAAAIRPAMRHEA